MPYLLNVLYAPALALVVIYTLLLIFPRDRSVFCGFWRKLSGAVPLLPHDRPVIWFHAASIGEALVCRPVITELRGVRPDVQCVLSVTTAEGYRIAVREFTDIPVFFTPFDFTWSVRRVFRALRPAMFVIAENDFWPNRLREATERNVPIAIFNTRIARQERLQHKFDHWLLRPLLSQVKWWGAVTQEDADQIRRLFGIDPSRLVCIGSLKFDGILRDRQHPRLQLLRARFGWTPQHRILVAGSTHPPEERLLLEIAQALSADYPMLRLVIVPRNAERFGSVRRQLQQSKVHFAAYSETLSNECADPFVMLGDAMGELRDIWGLADFAFVGGSLARQGGQNLVEPASYGVPIAFGPHVWNFQSVADSFMQAGAVQVRSTKELEATIRRWLEVPDEAARLGARMQDVVRREGSKAMIVARGILSALVDDKPGALFSSSATDLVRAPSERSS